MKLYNFIFFLFLLTSTIVNAQSWTPQQLKKANTAEHATYMNQTERDVIMYINLARLYPIQYLKIEILGQVEAEESDSYFKGAKYISSLIRHLRSMKPTHALVPDPKMYESVKCFSKESGEKGIVGHDRITCKKFNFSAECCFYGLSDAREIVAGWLIDEDVPSLGHRMICLDERYGSIGVSLHPHVKWDICTVADFEVK